MNPPLTAAEPQAAESVLDPATLARLQDLDPDGHAGLVPRVLRTYHGSLQRLLPQAQAAMDAGDGAALRYVAHTLKSSSSSVGALRLAALCQTLERRLVPPVTQGCEALVQDLLAEGGRVQSALSERLADPA